MTNLADLLPAGGGQNNTDFVADGNISSGAPVILTAAGKAAASGHTRDFFEASLARIFLFFFQHTAARGSHFNCGCLEKLIQLRTQRVKLTRNR